MHYINTKSSIVINTTSDKMSSSEFIMLQYILPCWVLGSSLINHQDLFVCRNIFPPKGL